MKNAFCFPLSLFWRGGIVLILSCLVACPANPPAPVILPNSSNSSPIALEPDGRALWVVNPDADSVTRVNLETLTAETPVPVGDEPWSVTVTPDNTVLVMNRASGNLSFLEHGFQSTVSIGSEPGGVALSPSGRTAFVSVSSQDELAVLDVLAHQVKNRIKLERMPWAVAVTNDGDSDDEDETVIVTHRQARLKAGGLEASDDGKEGVVSLIRGSSVNETTIAPYDFGFANVLEGLAIKNDTVFVTHLLNSPALPRDFEHTVSGAMTSISLEKNQEILERRLHINETDFSTPVNFPVALAVHGSRAYVVLAGTDAVMGINLELPDKPKLIGFWAVGQNPRGIVVNQQGTQAYVMNYLSRDVSVLDLSDEVARAEVKRVKVVPETLSPNILRGKILFHNANDPRLSHLGWISCASCHPDGSTDGTTWVTPDGVRQTQALWKLEGTAPFHASATRDEIQDFETDIEGLMHGVGLAPGLAKPELGTPNSARSSDLDALAEYVLHGIRVPRAPQNLNMIAVARGHNVFVNANCQSCHGGEHWTNSSLPGAIGTIARNGELEVLTALREVGTFNLKDVLGVKGFDVPSLLGLHSSAPYLHDGSAISLAALLENTKHTKIVLTPKEQTDLSVFLESVDSTSQPIMP